jgi:hypothetical protein
MHLFIAVDRIEIKGAKVKVRKLSKGVRGGEVSTAASTEISFLRNTWLKRQLKHMSDDAVGTELLSVGGNASSSIW